MVGIISVEEAKSQEILEEIMREHPDTLNAPEGFLTHSHDSAMIMREILDKIFPFVPTFP